MVPAVAGDDGTHFVAGSSALVQTGASEASSSGGIHQLVRLYCVVRRQFIHDVIRFVYMITGE